MKFVTKEEAYENLANAIVVSAADEYKEAYLRVKRNPYNEGTKQELKGIESFFYSDWFLMLTKVDAGYLLRRIREMVDEEEDKRLTKKANPRETKI